MAVADELVNNAWLVRCRPKRLLFVEDDPVLPGFIRTVIDQHFRAELFTASTVSIARMILQNSPPFDAAILDYTLTNGKGVEIYRELLKSGAKTQVIFLTGLDDAPVRREVEKVGPARIYTKDRLTDLEWLTRLFSEIGIQRIT